MTSLGYVAADWITELLPSPADPSKPFELTTEQVRFLLAWYGVDDRGRFVYRRGLLEMPKGYGKSPLMEAVALFEFAGPCLFDGLDAEGRPAGRPWGTGGSPPPWIQVAASSESQAAANVYSLIWAALEVNDGAAAEVLGIDQGRSRLYLKDQPAAKLEAVTAEAGSREGQRVTFAVLDESHLMTKQTGGTRLARTLLRNAAKMGGRVLECANAPELGAGSVAEHTFDAYEAGEPGILFVANRPSVEPTPDMSDEELLGLLRDVYGDATWVDLDRILADARDPATTWSEGSRYYFNTPSAGLDHLVDPARWAELESDEAPAKGSRVALAFLGAATDSAALLLCDADGQVAVVDIWEGEPTRRSDVVQAVAAAFDRYTVERFFVDARNWRSEAEEWADRWGEELVLAFPANSPRRMAAALDRFVVAVSEGELHHDGDERLAQHVANARLVAGRSGHEIQPAPGKDITAALAAVMVFEAAAQMPEERLPLVAWL